MTPTIDKKLIPEFFAIREGGGWYRYTGNGFTKDELKRACRRHLPLDGTAVNDAIALTAIVKRTTHIVHAIAFDDPALGSGYFARWDVISGWTTTRLAANARMGKYNNE